MTRGTRRGWGAGIVIAVTAFLLAACSSPTPAPSPDARPTASPTVAVQPATSTALPPGYPYAPTVVVPTPGEGYPGE